EAVATSKPPAAAPRADDDIMDVTAAADDAAPSGKQGAGTQTKARPAALRDADDELPPKRRRDEDDDESRSKRRRDAEGSALLPRDERARWNKVRLGLFLIWIGALVWAGGWGVCALIAIIQMISFSGVEKDAVKAIDTIS